MNATLCLQVHLTTECFQIRQKCLISFSILQWPVWSIWSCLKNYSAVRMSQGNFGRHESFRWLFRLIRKCQLPSWVREKVRGHDVALLSLKIIVDVSSLCRKFQETFFFYNNRNILILKCENTTSENRSQAIRKPPNILDEWNGYPDVFLAFLKL